MIQKFLRAITSYIILRGDVTEKNQDVHPNRKLAELFTLC
jgi:hypothetical protein